MRNELHEKAPELRPSGAERKTWVSINLALRHEKINRVPVVTSRLHDVASSAAGRRPAVMPP